MVVFIKNMSRCGKYFSKKLMRIYKNWVLSSCFCFFFFKKITNIEVRYFNDWFFFLMKRYFNWKVRNYILPPNWNDIVLFSNAKKKVKIKTASFNLKRNNAVLIFNSKIQFRVRNSESEHRNFWFWFQFRHFESFFLRL